MEFSQRVHGFCAPLYSSVAQGRPRIGPVVYFKMLMVGFLENLPSARAIAARRADALMLRRFLGYDLAEETPEHSSFTVILQRLSGEVYQAVFDVVLEGLRRHGLLRRRHLGIDSSVMEANASLRGLENRNTGEAYWEYVKRLRPKPEWTRRTLWRSAALTSDVPGAKPATRNGLTRMNLDKRYKIAASYNLSQLLRHFFGMGTPKHAVKAPQTLSGPSSGLHQLLHSFFGAFHRPLRIPCYLSSQFLASSLNCPQQAQRRFSTGC